MSTEGILARLGLLHLIDKPEELKAELHRRELINDDSTIEELEEINQWRAENNMDPQDIQAYLIERAKAKKDEEIRQREKNLKYMEEEEKSGIRKVCTCTRCGRSFMNWWHYRLLSKAEVESALKLGYEHEYSICSERCHNSRRL